MPPKKATAFWQNREEYFCCGCVPHFVIRKAKVCHTKKNSSEECDTAMKKIHCAKSLLSLLLCLVLAAAIAMPVRADDGEGEKVIYLTFDDGPSPYTAQLLEVLEKYGAKATFFVVDSGSCTREILNAMVEGGHSIGIHSLSHDYEKIYSSESAYMQDLYAMRSLIYEKTGVLTTMVRFPGGSSNTVSRRYCYRIMSRLAKRLTREGFCYFDWNVDSGDVSACRNTEQIYQNVIAGILEQPSEVVVLQHDIYPCSVQAVERILCWGKANGYRFEALTPGKLLCHHKIVN